jgi:hypothetical protein
MTGPTHTQYWVGPAPPGPPRIDATAPDPRLKGEGGHEEGKERWGEERERGKGRRGGKRVVPPRFKLVPTRFPWAGYGPAYREN